MNEHAISDSSEVTLLRNRVAECFALKPLAKKDIAMLIRKVLDKRR